METGRGQGSEPKYAQRIDPKTLTPEQLEHMRRIEMAQWAKRSGNLKGRNIITGLAIGGLVLGIYGYTFFSVSQEKFLDELEEEAKLARARYPKTSGN
ncbi:cytochrome c oxidase assembly factor 3 homolog, mitochondrial [Rana temporaria]|uniref:cytochrome c oxidase assembly factor 3 homolog, mitochondrial n=1 Tax=Rana temporaria TaxID=8407 RepID=UPI001AACDFC8|nr:cytochrome c oxidase assembly factor 3 homolog, mitochondrial [Rana temporaria]